MFLCSFTVYITPHYKWRCKNKGLSRYQINSEVFLTHDFRIEWRHQWRWYMYDIKFVHKSFSFRKQFGTVLTEEIRTEKFCNEVFVMPKYLMSKLNIPESASYISPLCAIMISQQYCRITVIWFEKILLHLHLERGVVQCAIVNSEWWLK